MSTTPEGEYDKAIADYTEAIRLDPKNALACFNRGLVYQHNGDYDRAIADFTEAIRLNPTDADSIVLFLTLLPLGFAFGCHNESMRVTLWVLGGLLLLGNGLYFICSRRAKPDIGV